MTSETFHIMPSRLVEMESAIRGYDSTSTFLVGASESGQYIPLGIQDDFGLSFYGTILHHFFNVPVEMVFPALLLMVVTIGFGYVQWGLYKKFAWSKSFVMMSALNVVLAIFTFKRGDVYATNYIAAAILFAFLIKPWKSSDLLMIQLIFASFILGSIELIRSKCGLGAFISLLTLVFLLSSGVSWTKKIIISAGMLIFFSFHVAIKNDLAYGRNQWFEEQQRVSVPTNIGHPVWHSIYIGLGIVPNAHGISYRDEVAADKVKQIGGSQVVFCSEEYEKILKKETARLLKEDPIFIFKSLGLKLVICLAVMIFLGFPLWYYKEYNLFMVAAPFILLSILPAVLVYPRINYMLGAILFMTLLSGYTMVSKSIKE